MYMASAIDGCHAQIGVIKASETVFLYRAIKDVDDTVLQISTKWRMLIVN